MGHRFIPSAVILSIFLVSSASAATYVVQPDGTGDFPTIQAAINAVVDTDIIELADGTFTGDGNRDLDYLGKAITIRSQSGDPSVCVIDCEETGVEHRGVFFHAEGPGSVLQGITITNGLHSYGAGVWIINHGNQPTITNCVFASNFALGGGGGVCVDGCSVNMTGCTFYGNYAINGGGLLCITPDPTLVVSDCMFRDNCCSNEGGGAWLGMTDGNTIENCTFVNNSAFELGGAVYHTHGSGLTLAYCSFSSNATSSLIGGGGAIYSSYCRLTLEHCDFLDNATVDGYGGAVAVEHSEGFTATDCLFDGNIAASLGGGLFAEECGGQIQITDCNFTDNSANYGGGFRTTSCSDVLVTGTVFAGNTVLSGGGGVSVLDADPCRFYQCTFSDNEAPAGSGIRGSGTSFLDLTSVIIAFGVDGEAVRCTGASDAAALCCDLYDNEGGDYVGCLAGWGGENGNISEDPLFCDRPAGDFHLHENSPCGPFSPPNEECPQIGALPVGCGVYYPILNIDAFFNAARWYRWVGPRAEMPDTVRFHLELVIPDPNYAISHVAYFVADSSGNWIPMGSDVDATEPWFDTVGDAQPLGDAWQVVAAMPIDPQHGCWFPIDPMHVKAIAHEGARAVFEFETEMTVDLTPPSLALVGLDDWQPVVGELLPIVVDPNGTEVDSIWIYLRQMEEIYEKGIPGIGQPSDPTYAAPVATAQCLKYFEQQGDSLITGGLAASELVDSLAAAMSTDQGADPGTYYSNWVGGLADWIMRHGAGYSLRAYRHFGEDGGWTWTRDDWKRIRDELQRSQNVLLGIFFETAPGEYAGGHALTLNGIENAPLTGGDYQLSFKDPWNGQTVYGEINPEIGRLANLGGAGGDGAARIGATLVVCPRETEPGNPGSEVAVYQGPNPYPNPIEIAIPEMGPWFVDVVVMNTSDHAHRTTTAVVRREAAGAPEVESDLPKIFSLGRPAPNPFRAASEISFAVPWKDRLRIDVYDVTGRKVRTLLDRPTEPGFHAAIWDGRDDRGRTVAAGLYYVRLTATGFGMTRSVTLLR